MSYGGGYGDSEKPAGPENSFDRDRRLEERYGFEREPDVSVLQYVSQRQEELAREFFEWRRGGVREGPVLEALQRWEVSRFGDRLFESAHRLLWFRVRAMMLPGPPALVREVTRPELPEAERQRRFDEAVGRLAREKAVPA
jgi:hypothetical protein